VRVRSGKVSRTDGPYVETKEQLGGYYLIKAKDLNDAVAGGVADPRREARHRRGPSDHGVRAAVDTIESVYRAESRRVLATLIRLLGDFDLAEEALQDAFAAALERWPREGVPASPRSWLISTGRFRAIDRLRKKSPRSPW